MNLLNASYSNFSKGINTIASTGYSIVTNEKSICELCQAKLSKVQATLGIVTFESCTLCKRKGCAQCIHKSTELLPPNVTDALGVDRLKWICVTCDPIVTNLFMKMNQKVFCEQLDQFLNAYFRSNQQQVFLFVKPGTSKDTMTRKFYRVVQVADYIVGFSQYAYLQYAYKAMKYAFMGKELYSMLIAGDFLNVLGPLAGAMSSILRKEELGLYTTISILVYCVLLKLLSVVLIVCFV